MTVVDDRFPRWFESIELEPESGRFGVLRDAADAVGSRLELGAALDLVAYAVGRTSPSAFSAVHAAVSENDRMFAAAAGDLEPRLVATAALARVLENDDDRTAVVAGAVLSADFAGLHSPVEELPQLARAALARRFRGLRDRVALPDMKLEDIFAHVPRFAGEMAQPAQQIDPLLRATKMLTEQLTSTLATLGQRFETRLDAADEELDILWWAFTAQGGEDRLRWGELNAPEATLLRTGLELADRHRFKAEIPSVHEILRRVLGSRAADEYSVAEIVIAAGEDVALDDVTPGPLLPILTSRAEYLAFKDAEFVAFQSEHSWMNSAGRYGVDPTIRRRGDEIAAQTLRELLLARALG